MIWPLPSQQLQLQRTTGGVSSSAACTPHPTNEQVFCLTPDAATFSEPPHMWALLVSLVFFRCSSVTVGFSGSEVAVSLCGVALPHGDPQAGQLCSCECPQELSCHCMGISRDQAHMGVESTQHFPGFSVHHGCLLPHQNDLNFQHRSSPVLQSQSWLPVSEERYMN